MLFYFGECAHAAAQVMVSVWYYYVNNNPSDRCSRLYAARLHNVLILPESWLGWLNRAIFKLKRSLKDWLGLKDCFVISLTW